MTIKSKPDDVLGLAIYNLLNPLFEEEKYRKKVEKLKTKVIALEIKHIYGLTLRFNNGEMLIEYGAVPKYNLKIIMTLEALVKIAEGKLGLIGAFLKRQVKVKKIYNVFTILKFKGLLFPALQAASKKSILENVVNIL